MLRVDIIGVGPGAERFLTLDARERICTADLVVATQRLADAFGHLNPNMAAAGLAQIPEAVRVAGDGQRVAVLVSGDSGFFSLGKSLPARLREAFGSMPLAITQVSGISSMQYLAAAAGCSHDDATIVSLHGRSVAIVPFVCYNPKVFALTGGQVKAHDAINDMVRAGLGQVAVTAGENLGLPSERILTGTAEALAGAVFADLTCLLLGNDAWCNPHEHIPDSAFIRGKTPMTKQAVRTLAIAALNIQPGDTVADIGAGTGSVAVEMARKACAGSVIAVERNELALDLLARNRRAFGAFNIRIVPGEAPGALDSLPTPDKVFIGGSGGRLPVIMQTVFARNAAVRVVVTAVTLESLHTAVQAFAALGIEADIVCLNAAVAQKAGDYHMMKAENPVYIISGGRDAP